MLTYSNHVTGNTSHESNLVMLEHHCSTPPSPHIDLPVFNYVPLVNPYLIELKKVEINCTFTIDVAKIEYKRMRHIA